MADESELPEPTAEEPEAEAVPDAPAEPAAEAVPDAPAEPERPEAEAHQPEPEAAAEPEEPAEPLPPNPELERTLESLLFLSSDPVTVETLATATETDAPEVRASLEALRQKLDDEGRGIIVRELAGGFTLASHPASEDAARALFAKPRTPPLTPAQAETLAIVAYLQPISRPEIARIRGVNAESAAQALLERGVIEEGGRSQFGAALYRTSDLFLKLFGLQKLDDLPPITEFDPSPELEEDLRERLLRAGEQRAGGTGP